MAEKYKFIAEDRSSDVLLKPLTADEVLLRLDGNDYLEGIVTVDLASLVDSDFENFLNLLSVKLIGNVCLMNITYSIVGCSGDGCVLLLVTGQIDRSDFRFHLAEDEVP